MLSQHSDKCNALDEMIILGNGPALHRADNLLDKVIRYCAEDSKSGK